LTPLEKNFFDFCTIKVKLEIWKHLSDRLVKNALCQLNMLIRQNGGQNKRNIVTYAVDNGFSSWVKIFSSYLTSKNEMHISSE